MKEEEFIQKVLPYFYPHFIIHREIWDETGKHRIDTVLQDKVNKKICFGIEFKPMDDSKRGTMIGANLKQAIRYSTKNFIIPGLNPKRLPIFICPPISQVLMKTPHDNKIVIDEVEYFRDRHDQNHHHHTFNGMLGAFKIGEVRATTQEIRGKKEKRLWLITSNQIIWDSRYEYQKTSIIGLHEKNYNELMDKISKL